MQLMCDPRNASSAVYVYVCEAADVRLFDPAQLGTFPIRSALLVSSAKAELITTTPVPDSLQTPNEICILCIYIYIKLGVVCE